MDHDEPAIVRAIRSGIERCPSEVRPALQHALGTAFSSWVYGPTNLRAARMAYAACKAELAAIEAAQPHAPTIGWIVMALHALAHGREQEAATALSGLAAASSSIAQPGE